MQKSTNAMNTEKSHCFDIARMITSSNETKLLAAFYTNTGFVIRFVYLPDGKVYETLVKVEDSQ